jgi:ArsR family transcriptional regulator
MVVQAKPAESAAGVDLIFRAFSDRPRLRVLNLLRHREELCVCEIVELLGMPQARVSQHLAYLRRAGLVADRKDGLWVYYRLARPRGAFHRKMIECLSCCLSQVPELRRDREHLQQLAPGSARNPGKCGDRCC